MSARPVVLVTDGEQRAALATVRSLGRAGYVVHVCSVRARSLAGASRYSASETEVPDPLREPEAFATAVERLAAEAGADVLLPIAEPSLLALLPHRERFRSVIPFPALTRFTDICDKALVLSSAVRHGIAVPRQVAVQTAAEGEAVAGSLQYPVVLKPSRSVAGPAANRTRSSVLYATNAETLGDTLRGLAPEAYPILLQERITGPGFAISVLLWDGEVRAAFGHRRLREKPPSGGVSVLRESIPLDVPLLERSVALLGDFEWQGVAMVEYKLDARTGTPYLMEINGRLWGSLQLAIDAGVDFPRLLVEAALGGTVAPMPAYPAGVRTRWMLGDLDHLLAMLRRSRQRLNLPAGAPGRLQTLAGFVRAFGPGYREEVLRLGDARPFFREATDWLRGR